MDQSSPQAPSTEQEESTTLQKIRMALLRSLFIAFLPLHYNLAHSLVRNIILPTRQSNTLTLGMTMPTTPRILGVCGGIGSGKSSACRVLVEECGCIGHIDSDRLAHTVYEPGPASAIGDVVQEFGSSIIGAKTSGDDTENVVIDRQKLGSIVFADPAAMSKLERIVWPHVRRKVQDELEKLCDVWKKDPTKFRHPVIVLEAAVLLDAGWQNDIDGVWVVSTARDVALQRLQSSRGLSEAEASKRIDAQQSRRGIGSLEQEISDGVVTAVIQNGGSMEELLSALQGKLDDPSAWYERKDPSAL